PARRANSWQVASALVSEPKAPPVTAPDETNTKQGPPARHRGRARSPQLRPAVAPCRRSFLAFFLGFLTVWPLTQSVTFFFFLPASVNPARPTSGRLAPASRLRPP